MKPTLAEIHARPHESLWQYLSQIPGSFEAQVFYALMLGAVLGMLLHYARAVRGGTVVGSPISYFLQQNWPRSLAAVVGVAAELIMEVGSGLFVTDTVFVGWSLVMLSGFKTGYLGDSLLNKGSRAGVLTREEDTPPIQGYPPRAGYGEPNAPPRQP